MTQFIPELLWSRKKKLSFGGMWRSFSSASKDACYTGKAVTKKYREAKKGKKPEIDPTIYNARKHGD